MATLPETGQATPNIDEFTPRSSFIESVKYDRKAYTLDIHFKSGSIRRHLFCYPATFETFRQAPDHSSFYARAIKGKLMSMPLVNKSIGRQESHPLKHHHQRRTLDHGTRKQQPAGTTTRAGF